MVVKVFLTIVTEQGRLDEIYDQVHSFEEVDLICRVESGPYDIVALVIVQTLDDYRKLIERLASLEHLEDFESFITLDI